MDKIYSRAGFSSCITYDDFPVFIYVYNKTVYRLLGVLFAILKESFL